MGSIVDDVDYHPGRRVIEELWPVRTTWIITVLGWGMVALVTATAPFTTIVSDRSTGTGRGYGGWMATLGRTDRERPYSSIQAPTPAALAAA